MGLKSKVGPVTAILVTGAAVLWMVAGGNGITLAADASAKSETTESQVAQLSSETKALKRVQAKTLTANTIATSLTLTGTTQASDSLALLSGYAGKIDKIHFNKGDVVTKGSVILTSDTRALRAEINQAQALLKQKELELDGASRLVKQKLASAVSLAAAKTEVAQAEATLKTLQVNLENAKLIAPFTGILNELNVTETQFISAGFPVGQLIALNPLIVNVNIPQKQIEQVKLGTLATIMLNSGLEVTGPVSFVDAVANSGTRSIKVEVQINNSENLIPAGITTKVVLSLPDQSAHGFSPALLTLDKNGHTAVKTLDIDSMVTLSPVTIIKSDRDQIWVNGLPKNVNLITVGQGFTEVGDKVEVHFVN